jgi:hypothetical protein
LPSTGTASPKKGSRIHARIVSPERRIRKRSELFSPISLFPFAFSLIRGYINAIDKLHATAAWTFHRFWNKRFFHPGAADSRNKHLTGMGILHL